MERRRFIKVLSTLPFIGKVLVNAEPEPKKFEPSVSAPAGSASYGGEVGRLYSFNYWDGDENGK